MKPVSMIVMLVGTAVLAAAPVMGEVAATRPAEEEEEHVSAEEGEFERVPEEERPEPEKPEEGLIELAPDVWLDWENGLILRSQDRKSQLRFGGSVMGDFGWVDGRGLGETRIDLDDDSQWRRNRVYLSGLIQGRFEFKGSVDFAGSGTKLVDAWVRWRDLPVVGDVTAGHQKVPFSLEHITSGLHTTFLERALPDVFVAGRAWGIMANNQLLNQRATWSAGVFRSTDDECSGSEDNGNACSFAGRLTCLPWYIDKGRELLHVGVSYSMSRPKDPIRYRSRPEAHFLDFFSDTGHFDVDRTNVFGCEAAWVDGPLSLQGEYISSVVDSSSVGDTCFNGFYLQGSYFLTGERRRYNTRTAVFGQVVPKKDFLTSGGPGAWEVAARYSFLDLDSGSLADSARSLQDVTLGLNWYLNAHMRMSWNYIRSCVDGSDTSGDADIFLMRLQLAF